jgi:5-methylcytosine-specific restriction endonuclease McrA
MARTCTRCRVEKEDDEFYWKKSGKAFECKACRKSLSLSYYYANHEAIKAKYRQTVKSPVGKAARWRRTMAGAKYHAKMAASRWMEKEKVAEFYMRAHQLTNDTGVLHVVDHIIPLRHAKVCGLHNEFNLQVIKWTDNAAKSNSFQPQQQNNGGYLVI